MNITIIGDGSFGSFLKDILKDKFVLTDNATSIILAVPFSAYEEVARQHQGKHLINVCSVQRPSTDILLKYSNHVTSIHPLFGRRTPENKRFSIITYQCYSALETEFLLRFQPVSSDISFLTPEGHDLIMSKTHLVAVKVALLIKEEIEDAEGIDDRYIPNSFRLLREFYTTMRDMPKGTIDSILANPYDD